MIRSQALLLLSALSLATMAQEPVVTSNTTIDQVEETHTRGSWEIGLGALGTNWSRVNFSNFRKESDKYLLTLDAQHLLGGAQLYVAHELLPWLYIDLQGSASFAPVASGIGDKETKDQGYNQLYLGGLGLQFRLTPLFSTSYVEPYLRVGINYLYRNFKTPFSGTFENDITNTAHWTMVDTWNRGAVGTAANHSSIPASVGLGVKGWLSDHFGLGIQGEYLMPVNGKGPNFAQASASIIWRIGGKSKRFPAKVTYVQAPPVERVVEKVVEKEVLVPEEHVEELYKLLNAVYFKFDTEEFTDESVETLDKLANLIKQDPAGRYLIIGMTDARGSVSYNKGLSDRRARAVYQALIYRGVDRSRIKWVGVGKGASVVSTDKDHRTREGDRKVLIERILNDKYWDTIK